MTHENDWRQRAACTGMWGAFNIPHNSGRAVNAHIARAKAVCSSCPVKAECLDAGLANDLEHPDDRYSIYGGLTPRERNGLRHAGQPINHGTPHGYKQHYNRGEHPCDACRDAFNTYALRTNRAARARRREGDVA